MKLFSAFYPKFCFDRVEDISVDFLRENFISALILDIDNTLVAFGVGRIENSVKEWIQSLREAQIKMVLLSNGTQKRKLAISRELAIPLVTSLLPKPFLSGFCKAVEILGVPKDGICAVGDIIFTDILGANLLGVKTILVKPLSGRDFFGTRFWRFLERALKLRRPR